MTDTYIEPFYYKTKQNKQLWSGAHASKRVGTGYEFYGIDSFSRYPDAKRIDVRATIRDPFNEIQVRRFFQQSKIPITLIIDGSSSMLFENKLQEVTKFIQSAIVSVSKTKDTLNGFYCAEAISEINLENIHQIDLMKYYESKKNHTRTSYSLEKIYKRLHKKKALVFLVSDFHFDQVILKKIINTLNQHVVVPMVIWNKKETNFPDWGISKVVDSETGKARTILFTPSKKLEILKKWQHKKRILSCLFERSLMPVFFMDDEFKADKLSEYFLKQS